MANRKRCCLPADNILIAMGCIIRHSHCVVSKASPPNPRHVIIYLFMKYGVTWCRAVTPRDNCLFCIAVSEMNNINATSNHT